MPVIIPFSGIGDAPAVILAEMDGDLLRVTFSEDMRSNSALLDAANYTITEDAGSAPRLVLGVQVDGIAPSPSVLLTLDGPTTNGVDNYNVAVDLSVEDLAGNTLDPLLDDVDFDGLTAAATVDHVSLGLARLIEQYRDKTRCRAYLRAILTPLQSIDQALSNVEAYRSIESSFGAQLDRLGETFNQLRTGLSDAEYRRVLEAIAYARSAKGTGDDVLRVLEILDDGFAPLVLEMIEHFPAGFISAIEVPLGRNDLGLIYASVVRLVKGNAIRSQTQWQQQGATHFVWEGETGEGFAEESDPVGTGGIWAEAV